MKALNDTKLILNDEGGHSCSFSTNLVSFRTFKRSLFPKPVSCPEIFCRFLQQDSSSCASKGQLISKCPLGVFKYTKKLRISALASKKILILKNKDNLFFFINYLIGSFFI